MTVSVSLGHDHQVLCLGFVEGHSRSTFLLRCSTTNDGVKVHEQQRKGRKGRLALWGHNLYLMARRNRFVLVGYSLVRALSRFSSLKFLDVIIPQWAVMLTINATPQRDCRRLTSYGLQTQMSLLGIATLVPCFIQNWFLISTCWMNIWM